MREVKRAYTVEDVADRATRVIHGLVGHGVTLIRSYVDVDTIVGLRALEGVLAARERCRHLARIELIAFPQEGIWCDPGTDELMRTAVERGADVVGGMPYAEMIEADSDRHIDFAFDLARRFDRDVQMHVDETDDPGRADAHAYAVKAIQRGLAGPRDRRPRDGARRLRRQLRGEGDRAGGPRPDEHGDAPHQAHARGRPRQGAAPPGPRRACASCSPRGSTSPTGRT